MTAQTHQNAALPLLGPAEARKRLKPAIAEALREGADTLRRLPMARHSIPAKARTSWPDVVRDSLYALMGSAGDQSSPARPTGKQIDEMEQVLDWLWLLEDKQRRVVWARALGFPWRHIGATLGCNAAQARYRHALALDRLADKLHELGWQVCARSPFGKSEAQWDARDWELARTIGVAWVLCPPQMKSS